MTLLKVSLWSRFDWSRPISINGFSVRPWFQYYAAVAWSRTVTDPRNTRHHPPPTQNWPTLERGFSATAELLVSFVRVSCERPSWQLISCWLHINHMCILCSCSLWPSSAPYKNRPFLVWLWTRLQYIFPLKYVTVATVVGMYLNCPVSFKNDCHILAYGSICVCLM